MTTQVGDHAFWTGRRVAVTGATGFLGSHLTPRLLALGAAVVVLVRDDLPSSPLAAEFRGAVTEVRGDITDVTVLERMLAEHRVSTVVHLAAQSQVAAANRDPLTTLDVNVRGTWSVLEAARRAGTAEQIVVASSDKAYGAQPVLPYTEDMDLLAHHPYDASKACAEILARTFHASYGLPVSITRCANLYGPGDVNWDRLVPGTLRSLLGGERPVIRSDGSPTRDYLYVDDGARAVVRLTEAMAEDDSAVGEAFNFSAESPMTVLELVGALQRAVGTDLEADVRGEAVNEIQDQYLSSDKARRVLGWKPSTTTAEALVPTVEWYRRLLAPRG